MGGTMRLGSRRTFFHVRDCTSAKLYGNASFIDERHRHRYELNPEMIGRLESVGMSFTGKDETGQRMEIIELPDHPFFIGAQFHPEFKSRPGKPSPLFIGLIAASVGELGAVFENPAVLFLHPSSSTLYHTMLPRIGLVKASTIPCGNGTLKGVRTGYANGSMKGIHEDNVNGKLNRVYSDQITGICSNGNGFH